MAAVAGRAVLAAAAAAALITRGMPPCSLHELNHTMGAVLQELLALERRLKDGHYVAYHLIRQVCRRLQPVIGKALACAFRRCYMTWSLVTVEKRQDTLDSLHEKIFLQPLTEVGQYDDWVEAMDRDLVTDLNFMKRSDSWDPDSTFAVLFRNVPAPQMQHILFGVVNHMDDVFNLKEECEQGHG